MLSPPVFEDSAGGPTSTAAYIRMDLRSCLGYVGPWPKLSDGSHSIQTVTDQLPYSPTASNASLLSQRIVLAAGVSSLLLPHQRLPQPPCPSGPFTLLCPLLPSSDQVLWLCIFLSLERGQRLLVFSWFSVRSSASENVFPMHLQRKMYSVSTCSSRSLLIINMIKMAEKLWYAHMGIE